MTDLVTNDLDGAHVTLKKINQDAYASEFFKRVGNTEYRFRIKHLNESPKSGSLPMVRHIVSYTATTFSTVGDPPTVYESSLTIRMPLAGDGVKLGHLSDVVTTIASGVGVLALVNWETDIAGLT
jgi:hypothetical protein